MAEIAVKTPMQYLDKATNALRDLGLMPEGGAEARAGGSTHIRMSVDNADNPTMALLEGWIDRPADEGEPRWQMVPRTTP